MTIQEVVNRYMELYKQGKMMEIQDELYSAEVVCTEPEHATAFGVPTLTKGLDAVKAKGKVTSELIAEIHSRHCGDPVIGGNYFSVAMGRDVSFKNGQRRKMDEIAVFGVKDSKIVSETFFY